MFQVIDLVVVILLMVLSDKCELGKVWLDTHIVLLCFGECGAVSFQCGAGLYFIGSTYILGIYLEKVCSSHYVGVGSS